VLPLEGLQSLLQDKETPKAGEAMPTALGLQEDQTILPDPYPPVPLLERKVLRAW